MELEFDKSFGRRRVRALEEQLRVNKLSRLNGEFRLRQAARREADARRNRLTATAVLLVVLSAVAMKFLGEYL